MFNCLDSATYWWTSNTLIAVPDSRFYTHNCTKFSIAIYCSSCNPVLCTELVVRHSSQHTSPPPASKKASPLHMKRWSPFHIDCKMLMVNSPPPPHPTIDTKTSLAFWSRFRNVKFFNSMIRLQVTIPVDHGSFIHEYLSCINLMITHCIDHSSNQHFFSSTTRIHFTLLFVS